MVQSLRVERSLKEGGCGKRTHTLAPLPLRVLASGYSQTGCRRQSMGGGGQPHRSNALRSSVPPTPRKQHIPGRGSRFLRDASEGALVAPQGGWENRTSARAEIGGCERDQGLFCPGDPEANGPALPRCLLAWTATRTIDPRLLLHRHSIETSPESPSQTFNYRLSSAKCGVENDYYNYKGWHSIILLAITNYN